MNIYHKIWKRCSAIWFLFFLLLAVGSNCLAQEGRPTISLYYYESGERILMCAYGESDQQGVLFSLDENGKLHGMEPRRPEYEEDVKTGQWIMSKPANPALVKFQRILVGLPVYSGIYEPQKEYVKPLQETIGAVDQDGTGDGIWGGGTWTKLFQYIRDNTDRQETVDFLPLGEHQVRVYRLDTILLSKADSKEKKRLQKLLQDRIEADVKAASFPNILVEFYNNLISAATPAVTPTQDTSSKQPEPSTPEENIQPGKKAQPEKKTQPEKKGVPWWKWFAIIIGSVVVIGGSYLVGRLKAYSLLTKHIKWLISIMGDPKTTEPHLEQHNELLEVPPPSLAEQIKDIKDKVSDIRRDVKKIKDEIPALASRTDDEERNTGAGQRRQPNVFIMSESQPDKSKKEVFLSKWFSRKYWWLVEQIQKIVDIVGNPEIINTDLTYERKQRRLPPPSLAEYIQAITFWVIEIKDDVENIRKIEIPTPPREPIVDVQKIASAVIEKLKQYRIPIDVEAFIKEIEPLFDTIEEKSQERHKQVIEGQKSIINKLQDIDTRERLSDDTISKYHEILQSDLRSLYAQKLMPALIPMGEEHLNFSDVWFFTESWKLNSSNGLSDELEHFQEQLIGIESNLRELREQTYPRVIELSDKNTLQDYLSSYQEGRKQIEGFEPPYIPIVDDKLVQLQMTVILFIDRLDGIEIGYEGKIEAMLQLVSLRQLSIFEEHTTFREELHNIVDREASECEPGTILQVKKRGFMDRKNGKIIRKAYVITAE